MAILKGYRSFLDRFRPRSFAPRTEDRALAPQILEVAETYQQATDQALGEKAMVVRDAISTQTKPLLWIDFVIPTLALTTEAIRRTTGMTYYEVQLLAGMALSTGCITEVQTGEGKTITAAIPAVLHALGGRSVHVATVNAYLAERDFRLVSPAFQLLGITAGWLKEKAAPADKRKAYQQEVVYGTGYEFGFDYLRDQSNARRVQQTFLGERFRQQLRGNAAAHQKMVQRTHDVAIIDEIDSVLIDEANTPLVLSGATEGAARHGEVFAAAFRHAQRLVRDVALCCGRASTQRPADGRGTERELSPVGTRPRRDWSGPWTSYIEQSLRAHCLLRRDVDYVVQDGQVKLVDQYTGRIFSDRSWRDGLHQAVQFKEGVPVTEENKSIARISRQRYFGRYQKLCGMTGTATGHEHEFQAFYGLPIVVIPPRRPVQRLRLPTRYFATLEQKWSAIAQEVHARHATGQPILIGTKTIDESEVLAHHFCQLNIPHQLLNGKQDRSEADIVAAAGREYAVTIATNMAGRGTDIQTVGDRPCVGRPARDPDATPGIGPRGSSADWTMWPPRSAGFSSMFRFRRGSDDRLDVRRSSETDAGALRTRRRCRTRV